MSYIKIQPPGVMPLRDEDRMNVIRVVGGDSRTIDLNLFDPRHPDRPATPDNTKARVVLSETQFEDPIWSGEWYSGIFPDENRPGLCHIRIPRTVTSMLRRGSYLFSVRVCDPLMSEYSTEATGTFLAVLSDVYSANHGIPGSTEYRCPECRYYCIRTYSRELTAAEIAHNYAVDKARFGLPDPN